MFFKKRREAEARQEFERAHQQLATYRTLYDEVMKLDDDGEKYFRLERLDEKIGDTLHHPTLRDAAEAVEPAAKKSIWKWEAVGTTTIAGGVLLCLAGGPLGVAAGGTALIYGTLGCAAGGQQAVANARNARRYHDNEKLITDLRALRAQIRAQAKEAFRRLEENPEKIAHSAQCDKLLQYVKLRDAFTSAAKTRLANGAPPKPPAKPDRGFNL